VDRITLQEDGSFEVLERVEGGRHLVSRCSGPPALLGWATGERPEPRNDPQMGMKNMRTIMPALQKATAVSLPAEGLSCQGVRMPNQQRQTRIVRDMPAAQIAQEIFDWIRND
jgi:electron transfer flavoprotein beta subunit